MWSACDSGGTRWGSIMSGDGETEDFDVTKSAKRPFELPGSLVGAMKGGREGASQ